MIKIAYQQLKKNVIIRRTYNKIKEYKNSVANVVDKPVVILLYHRVANLKTDPQLLAVSTKNFYEQLNFLKNNYPVLRFEDDWSAVKETSFVVTFDDGYVDNYINALPILETLGIPATFFVSTENLGTENKFWWDELEDFILLNNNLPKEVSFEIKNKRYNFKTESADDIFIFYNSLHPLVKILLPDERKVFLLKLKKLLKDNSDLAKSRALTKEELYLLAQSQYATVGAHTVTHTALSIQSYEEQFEEIKNSKLLLEKIIGKSINTFSYPFGGKSDYNADSINIVQQLDFKKVASNFPGQVHSWTNNYELPRQIVRNWQVEEFKDKLKTFIR